MASLNCSSIHGTALGLQPRDLSATRASLKSALQRRLSTQNVAWDSLTATSYEPLLLDIFGCEASSPEAAGLLLLLMCTWFCAA